MHFYIMVLGFCVNQPFSSQSSPSIPSENRKFCWYFQGDQKGILGRKGLSKSSICFGDTCKNWSGITPFSLCVC